LWSIQILKGLDFLHANKLIHRNLKPSYITNFYLENLIFSIFHIINRNIYVIDAQNILIGDLGTFYNALATTNSYMAPEGNIQSKSDIW
jgi:serine/threonine protein kinase